MPSPFPGMNPFLEQPGSWRDFHHTFTIYLREALVPLVRPKYFVGIEERLYLSEWPQEERGSFLGLSDISIHKMRSRDNDQSTATMTLDAPLQVLVDIPEAKTDLNAVAIRDRDSEEIVTTIEILSPSNKFAGEDRVAYLEKRAEILSTKSNSWRSICFAAAPNSRPGE